MEGGQDLAAPPVDIVCGTASALLASMMVGSSMYSAGAGGFAKVNYIPQLVRVRQPAQPNSSGEASAVQQFAGEKLRRKQTITRRSASP